MGEHYRTYSAVFPIMLRNGAHGREVLLHRRSGTGYMDGMLDLAGGGHVEADEHPRAACCRECAEELGVAVDADDLAFAHLTHHFSFDKTYYYLYFAVSRWSGEPRIAEPEKSSELGWYPLDALPEDMIACRRADVRAWLAGEPYSERIDR